MSDSETAALAEVEGRQFYTSVIDGTRRGYLSGPFETHAEALADVERVRRRAQTDNARAWFYGFGMCSTPPSAEPLPA